MTININDKAYQFPVTLNMEQWSFLVDNFDFEDVYEANLDVTKQSL